MSNALAVRYQAGGEMVELNTDVVRNLLVTGKGSPTDQEISFFINLCKARGLNPFLREAYLIKYSDGNPASTVVGKDAFVKRARSLAECKGWSAGISVVTKDGQYVERDGSIVLPGERLVGGWCDVYIDTWAKPFKHTAALSEYNTGKSQWAQRPATMIRKVALVQALREAFPESFNGMYDSAEMQVDNLPEQAVSPEGAPVPKVINKEQVKVMLAMASNYADIAKAVLAEFGYKRSVDVLDTDYNAVMDAMEQRIMEHEKLEKEKAAFDAQPEGEVVEAVIVEEAGSNE